MAERRGGAGCVLLSGDGPKVIASLACFAAFLVYGACQGSLGAALPALASSFAVSGSTFGTAFTLRGAGYLVGTVGSAALLESKSVKQKASSEMLVCVAVMLTGLATGLMVSVNRSFPAVLFLFFVQGLGFGGVDTLANCVLPELWGTRVQPWMQALHSFFGIGAVVGPALVGGFGYVTAFIVLAVSSGFPLAGMLVARRQQRSLEDDGDQGAKPRGDGDGGGDEEEVGMVEVAAADVDVVVDDAVAVAAQEPPVAVPPPLSVRALLAIFFFVYVGTECAFGAWISTFALDTQVTDSLEAAAFTAAVFWAALAFGRVVAIPLAVYFSTTGMLRTQLALSVVGAVLAVTVAHKTYALVCVASAVNGYALSSIFPLAMTLVSDYGRVMDAPTTSLFVIGSTFGEGIVPVCLGLAMAVTPEALPYCVCVCVGVLIAIYLAVHVILSHSSEHGKL